MSLRCCRFNRRFYSAAVSYSFPIPRDLLSGSSSRPDLMMSNADRCPQQLSWTVELLIRLRDLDTAAEYARLAYSSRINCEFTIKTCDSIIGAMCEAKRYRDALDLFHHFFNERKSRSVNKSPNHVVKAICELGRVDDALVFFRALQPHPGLSPIYSHLTKALVYAGRFEEALCLVRQGPVPLACSNLIRGFLNLGNLDMANQLLEEFEYNGYWAYDCTRNEGAYPRVVFIEHWLKQGNDEEAMRCYQSLLCDHRFQNYGDSINSLLQLFLSYGKKKEAWELFHRIVDGFYKKTMGGVVSETIDIMVRECFNDGRFREGIETFYQVKAKVGSSLKALDYNNVITRCCEQGLLSEAECLFAELSSHRFWSVDVFTYRAMMDAYLKAGRVDDALQMVNKMVVANLTKLALWMKF
ncbi:hypothetical protein EUTSA_v10023497mg [Eutrema salsugineum]|uniref:Pentacotripeptide-repeat region of PRORP domain-containing protein n=2 Tax=Eutrema salsugineum TaxID=72664 RepID=V4MCH4_EUTSA|nr:hypothetical protein EUTSA_v10023497mg [Eutrema salsugineum]